MSPPFVFVIANFFTKAQIDSTNSLSFSSLHHSRIGRKGKGGGGAGEGRREGGGRLGEFPLVANKQAPVHKNSCFVREREKGGR